MVSSYTNRKNDCKKIFNQHHYYLGDQIISRFCLLKIIEGRKQMVINILLIFIILGSVVKLVMNRHRLPFDSDIYNHGNDSKFLHSSCLHILSITIINK